MGCSSYSAYRKTPTGKALKLNPRKNKKGEIVDYDCKQPEYFRGCLLVLFLLYVCLLK